MYHSKGYSQSEIAHKLNVNQSTISRDIAEVRKKARGWLDLYVKEEIPNESQFYISGLNQIINNLWEIIEEKCEEHLDIASELLSISKKNSKVFFINSGAEAVENAIKIAYKKMGPLSGVSCISDFYGRTLGALSFTMSKEVQKTNFPELPVKRIKFCTVDTDLQINQLENLLKEYRIAFIITEIIQGEGGLNVASKLFIQNIRKIADEYNVPLIFDEVQSGMGRTGKSWAYQHYGVEPDIMTVAKALQVGATVYDKKYEPSESGALSSTWGGGSRIDIAIGSIIIETITKNNLI